MVLAVLLNSSSQDQVFIDYVNEKNRKVINLSNVNMATYPKQALVGFHAFTGNDYITFHRFLQKEKQQPGRKW